MPLLNFKGGFFWLVRVIYELSALPISLQGSSTIVGSRGTYPAVATMRKRPFKVTRD